MTWSRLFFSSLSLLALAIGGWSAWHATQSRHGAAKDVVMLLPGPLPTLNPFFPADEAERQIRDLIHEPLIRIDREGRLATALAEQWQWRQDMTCWFDSAESARAAAQELREQPVEKRAAWDLESVATQGAALVVRFVRPGTLVAAEVQAVLAASVPQKLTFIRIASSPAARATLEAFARHPDHVGSTKRLWFDDDGTCEIVTTRTGLQAQEQLFQWLAPQHQPMPEITPVGEVTALLEPVLDFRLKPGLQWPDGHAITAADVQATLTYVMPRSWPLPGRDAFRQVQSITEPEPGIVRVVYRKAYSPALPAWTALPILPASWLSQQAADAEPNNPPGAGSWQISRRESTRLWLKNRSAPAPGAPAAQVQMLAALSPLQQRIGHATQTFDIAWPGAGPRTAHPPEAGLTALASPARHQLMLVWQTSTPQLADGRIRRALGLALDRAALHRDMPGGLGRMHDSFFPPGYWFSTETTAPAAADREKALRLLSEAGWVRDVEGRLHHGEKVLSLRFVIPDSNSDRQRLAQALVQQWRQIGVQAEVIEVPARSYLMELQAGRFDAALIGGELATGWDVLPFWHSSHSGGLGLNVSQTADPKLDLLLEALVSEFDADQVPRRAAEVEARLQELQPAMPLFTDLTEITVRQARFPGLADLDTTRGITLQELLPALIPASRPRVRLEMLSPK